MTPDASERYSRQIRFQPIGEEGQERLLAARVGIVGCGALGNFQAGALARAGVGTLVIIDRDYVDESNLQRQWLFDEEDAKNGLPKSVAAARHLRRINSHCEIQEVVADLTPDNIEDLLSEVDLILDGTDNFATRYILNDFAVYKSIPWIYGAAVGSYGLAMPIIPGRTACLACVYPEAPGGAQPTCETAGVINAITSVVGSWQAGLATRLLATAFRAAEESIVTFDVWEGNLRRIPQPPRDPDCITCGQRNFRHLHSSHRVPVSLCGRNAVQIHEHRRPLDLASLGRTLKPLGDVRLNDFALRFFPAPYEMTVFPDGRAIIKGTTDAGIARGLYAKYIGT